MSDGSWSNQVVSSVVIVGPNGQLLMYTPAAAANDLVGSYSTVAVNDPYLNKVLAGFATYAQSSPGVFQALQLEVVPNVGAEINAYQAASESAGWSRISWIAFQNGLITLNGLTEIVTPAGLAGVAPVAQSVTTPKTNANLAGANPVSVSWTIPANDATIGTEYILEVPYIATMEGQTLELGLGLDDSGGTGTHFVVNDTISGAIVGAGIGIHGMIRTKIQVSATGGPGSGFANAFFDGTVNQTGALTTFANSGSIAGTNSIGFAFDTTVAHTLQVNSQWGAAAAGQTVTGQISSFTRTSA